MCRTVTCLKLPAPSDRLSSYFMLIENKRGNYSFLKGIAPYSAGVIAEADFEIVHVRLSRYFALRLGLPWSRHTSGKLGVHSRRCAEWSYGRRSHSVLPALMSSTSAISMYL